MIGYLERSYKTAILTNIMVLSFFVFGSCESNKAKAAEELPPPCHNGGITQVRTEEKLVLTTCTMYQPCTCDSQEIVFAKLKGPAGDPGAPGKPGEIGPRGAGGGTGPAGPAGRDAAEETKIAYCRHDPQTHVNHTMQLKPSEIVKNYSGYYGQADYPGSCGPTEGVCACDAPICRNPNPQMHHYFGETDYD